MPRVAADSKAHQQGWRISNKTLWGRRQVTSDGSPAYDHQRARDGGIAAGSISAQGGGVGEEGAGDQVSQAYSWLQTGRWSPADPR